ncbi:MAG TPA: extracellular solute-binding protein, partial [Clostridia bacterium]|nr:extracellular solute-binding protein [Clostridia bacterium]
MKKCAVVLAVILLLSLSFGCRAKEQVTLNVLNWGDYIDESVLKQFEAEHPGIKINYLTAASNEEMLIKLTAPDSIYDICFPSDYIIEKMIEKDMLHQLNKENIPNLKNIDTRFLDLAFDRDNLYSVPYMWGTVGILYNTDFVKEPVHSWRILWDEAYAGQILMYDSIRDT